MIRPPSLIIMLVSAIVLSGGCAKDSHSVFIDPLLPADAKTALQNTLRTDFPALKETREKYQADIIIRVQMWSIGTREALIDTHYFYGSKHIGTIVHTKKKAFSLPAYSIGGYRCSFLF